MSDFPHLRPFAAPSSITVPKLEPLRRYPPINEWARQQRLRFEPELPLVLSPAKQPGRDE